nr:uncharacterized protein I303_04793 [Kwoniella dejecticola CBS 10117]OBR85457.1 hypothetical protein I303_04793 [Kwoniella dejecticola CBS 10117]
MRRNAPAQQSQAGDGQANHAQSQTQNQQAGGAGVGRGAGGQGTGQQRGSALPVLTRPRAPALLPIKRDALDEGVSGAPTGQDSITLGQLRAHTAAMEKKQKLQQFDFRYDDTDTIMNELQEFYPYVEMANIAKQPEKFHGSFQGDWTSAPLARRKEYIEIQLEQLESPIHDTRRTAQGILLYLLQGTFEETTSPEMQLHWVIENAKAVRAVDGVATIVTGLSDAARKYTASADDKPPSSSAPPGTVPAQVDPYDDRSAELMDLLGMLYFIVEVFRTDETFGDELMAMSPPLPLVLFQMVASLKDRLPKGYPVKKVLLLLWKTLLACLGGMKEVSKARALSRELSGLPAEKKNLTKATPVDISTWRRDTAVKYPTFAPPTTVVAGVPNEKLAEGIKPLPSRPNYHSTEIPASQPRNSQIYTSPAASGSNPLPGTPAPSPPPSPKPKKQQYQTDPTRPFVFPYSRTSAIAPSSLVPFAISEADKLYHQHEYISLGLYQLWQAREECMREERGLGKSGLIGFSSSAWDDEGDEEMEEAMRREWKYEEEEIDAINQGNKEGAKLAREKKAAARRLHRVEVIYKNTLPIQQSCVIVLLKLLLATVTSPGATGGNLATGLPQGVTSPTQEVPPTQENLPPPTKEEIDIARHREITSKAVSAILLLLLKWFKASHILKFHYFAQLLFDSNCALLVLKMFGLTDLLHVVQTKNEVEDSNFFRYCQLNCSRLRPSPEDDLLLRQPPKKSPQLGSTDAAQTDGTADGEGEIEYISEYSWRNFFSTINFLKILQKITKHRNHRTYMLTTYKSSQILKRMLKVNHPMAQLQVLKLIKSQMPWCGRKWRQTNMKVITSIYLNCRPELRDDWLAGTDQENELEDALPQEYALRSLVQFYNKRHYAAHLAPLPSPEPSHKRSNSTSAVTLEDPALHHAHTHGHVHGASAGSHPRSSSVGESDVFPPRKSHGAGADLPYNPDGMIEFWLHEYEDILGEVFGGDTVEGTNEVWDEFGLANTNLQAKVVGQQDDQDDGVIIGPHAADRDDRAWNRLTDLMRSGAGGGGRTDEEISDSESVVSVGELGEDARMSGATFDPDTDTEAVDGEQDKQEEGRERRLSIGGGKGRRKSGAGENTWEHMSPTLALLPRSPAERRRSSSGGSPLRPVIPGKPHEVILGLGDNVFDDDDDLDTRGPMPIKSNTRDLEEREGGAVDEVEYTYGE